LGFHHTNSACRRFQSPVLVTDTKQEATSRFLLRSPFVVGNLHVNKQLQLQQRDRLWLILVVQKKGAKTNLTASNKRCKSNGKPQQAAPIHIILSLQQPPNHRNHCKLRPGLSRKTGFFPFTSDFVYCNRILCIVIGFLIIIRFSGGFGGPCASLLRMELAQHR